MREEKLHILVAEDAPGEAIAALRTLYPEAEGRMELTDVGSLATLQAAMAMVNPDVVLVDLTLARPEAVDAVRRLHRSAPSVPLIVLADLADKENAIRCLDVGAMHYLLKGSMDARTVERGLRAALERNTLDALTDIMRDPATNLYTRDGLLTLGAHALETVRRGGGAVVLLCALLENLADLRVELGPATAEQTLRDVAGLLSVGFRRTDVLARIGEGQFAALAVNAAEPSAPTLRQRVQRRVDTFNQLRDKTNAIRLKMAVGVWSAQELEPFAELLDRVEAELHAGPITTAGREEQPASLAGPASSAIRVPLGESGKSGRAG